MSPHPCEIKTIVSPWSSVPVECQRCNFVNAIHAKRLMIGEVFVCECCSNPYQLSAMEITVLAEVLKKNNFYLNN